MSIVSQRSQALDDKYRLKCRPAEPGLEVKQGMRDECDINKIVARFATTKELPLSSRPIQFGDATALPVLQDALQGLANARSAFSLLPDQVKAEINNDPSRLEAWVSDPRNEVLAESLGLFKPGTVEARRKAVADKAAADSAAEAARIQAAIQSAPKPGSGA